MSRDHTCVAFVGRAKCFLTYSCLALAMRGVFVNFVPLLTRNTMARRCIFADLYTWLIYNKLYIRLKLAGFSHILTKFIDVHRRTALVIVIPGVGCASCMCDEGIKGSKCLLVKVIANVKIEQLLPFDFARQNRALIIQR